MQSPAFPVGSSPSVAHLSQLETDVGPPRAAAAHLPAGGRPRCVRLAPLLPRALSRLQGPSRDSPSCWTSASPQALLGAQFLGLPLVSMTLAVLRRTAQGWAGWASVAVVRRSAHDEMGGRELWGGEAPFPSHLIKGDSRRHHPSMVSSPGRSGAGRTFPTVNSPPCLTCLLGSRSLEVLPALQAGAGIRARPCFHITYFSITVSFFFFFF